MLKMGVSSDIKTTAVGSKAKTTGKSIIAEKNLKRRNGEANASDKSAAKKPRLEETTDRTRWRMKDEAGRHTWHYLEDDKDAKEWPQSYADKWYLGLPLVCYP